MPLKVSALIRDLFEPKRFAPGLTRDEISYAIATKRHKPFAISEDALSIRR